MKHMIHINKLTGEGLGAPVELHKTIKGVLLEGLWAFARLETTIGQKKNPPSACPVKCLPRGIFVSIQLGCNLFNRGALRVSSEAGGEISDPGTLVALLTPSRTEI